MSVLHINVKICHLSSHLTCTLLTCFVPVSVDMLKLGVLISVWLFSVAYPSANHLQMTAATCDTFLWFVDELRFSTVASI